LWATLPSRSSGFSDAVTPREHLQEMLPTLPPNADPDNNFRFDATLGLGGGYIFNLSNRWVGFGDLQPAVRCRQRSRHALGEFWGELTLFDASSAYRADWELNFSHFLV